MYTFLGSVTPAETSLDESKVNKETIAGFMWKPSYFWCTMEIIKTCCYSEQGSDIMFELLNHSSTGNECN